MDRKLLLRALNILTEGGNASVAQNIRAKAEESRRSARSWSRSKGIQGLGIAKKITDNQMLPKTVLKVYVEKKLSVFDLDHPVPEKVRIPGIRAPISTDVEEIGKLKRQAFTSRARPAIGGVGLGHPRITVGTFGCLVRKRGQPSEVYILSNSHVLANSGLASAGDPILQPGRHDGGVVQGNVIAALEDWVPLTFSIVGFPNLMDAALAKPLRPGLVHPAIRLIGRIAGVSTVVRRGMMVQKTGRTTDKTFGEIKDIDFTPEFYYPTPKGGRRRAGFRKQVLCTRYTDDGDSGSVVLNKKRAIIGLHFAGSNSASVFNRIAPILIAFDVRVV